MEKFNENRAHIQPTHNDNWWTTCTCLIIPWVLDKNSRIYFRFLVKAPSVENTNSRYRYWRSKWVIDIVRKTMLTEKPTSSFWRPRKQNCCDTATFFTIYLTVYSLQREAICKKANHTLYVGLLLQKTLLWELGVGT
jgi:hypothetical protein